MTIIKVCSVTSWSVFENMASSSMSGAGPDGSTQVEDEVSLPRAAVNKMIKEMIPNIRVSNDARELILTCCKEFIHLVSSEANDICNVQTKKTISPDHIIAALGRLGFNQYLEEIKGVHAQFKSQASNKKKSNRLENLGRCGEKSQASPSPVCILCKCAGKIYPAPPRLLPAVAAP